MQSTIRTTALSLTHPSGRPPRQRGTAEHRVSHWRRLAAAVAVGALVTGAAAATAVNGLGTGVETAISDGTSNT